MNVAGSTADYKVLLGNDSAFVASKASHDGDGEARGGTTTRFKVQGIIQLGQWDQSCFCF